MKIKLPALSLCLGMLAVPLFAGSTVETSTPNETSAATFPFEFDAEFSYIGGSDVARGFRRIRDFDEVYAAGRFLYTPRIKFGILRLGAAYERFGFDMPRGVQLPDTLQSISAIVGLDTRLGDSILVRFEAQPGFYGTNDRFGEGTFHVPFILGGTYILNPNVQFVLGASVDYERKFPVFPGGGIRWRLNDKLVLNAVAPTPRLEFEASKSLTLYAGADLKGSTFRTDNRFGTREAGDRRLNHALLSYTEVRTGVGVEFKLSPDIKLSLEGGYLPYREFDFHRTNVRYHQEQGAPYGSIGFRAAF
ncbi:MAG: DUF6268 family outer membrane beta-barrel protein [Verrucomicrobiota bacterium]|nr:DUF6268 family outer membrane beta-barrel protein [Verrucomicrobiota bacterium]